METLAILGFWCVTCFGVGVARGGRLHNDKYEAWQSDIQARQTEQEIKEFMSEMRAYYQIDLKSEKEIKELE